MPTNDKSASVPTDTDLLKQSVNMVAHQQSGEPMQHDSEPWMHLSPSEAENLLQIFESVRMSLSHTAHLDKVVGESFMEATRLMYRFFWQDRGQSRLIVESFTSLGDRLSTDYPEIPLESLRLGAFEKLSEDSKAKLFTLLGSLEAIASDRESKTTV